MAVAAEFDRELRKLFYRRISWLRAALGKGRPGPAPRFTKKRVAPVLEDLAYKARCILLKKRGREEFDKCYVAKRQWHVRNSKGWGRRAKGKAFRRWYVREIRSHNCVYVFWSGRKCEYIGRTVRGKGRPSSSFDKYWFGGVTRVDIYSVGNPSLVAKTECLAIDIFDPRRNLNSSSRPKYAKKCPICSAEREIRRELKTIFPLQSQRG